MTRGKWVPRSYTKKEMDTLSEFVRMSREQHFLPPSLERPDGLCGNVTFSHLAGKMHNLLWFRALCDPQGSNPCCFNNKCTGGLSVQECQCPHCYDMRQPIHAEFATWVPSDPVCKIKQFHNKTDTCQMLGNSTVLMIGDSFMRHVYIALLSLLRSDLPHGPKVAKATSVQRFMCRGDYIYQQRCHALLDRDTNHCKNTTKLKFYEYISSKEGPVILNTITKLRDIPNSYVFLGIGIHDDFHFNIIAATSFGVA
ncbi:hypothetical protein EGW08_012392 [Elysia chlorotica]|uniref:Uncharacterized protein n=1 Tax=Elysia chlorotica TaxID=188477 RepID=A0A433TE76_ELYCH|nr:hypothetical protein EGW08_012392 [Elysia chlorotica]